MTKDRQPEYFSQALWHWGKFEMVKPLTGGYRNLAFLVKGQDEWYVLKTTRRSEAAMRWLERVYDAAEEAGFVVPRLLESTKTLWTESP